MSNILKKIFKFRLTLILSIVLLAILLIPEVSYAVACNSYSMKERYMGDDVAESCWFCKVVVVMTNAFLLAANDALSVCQELGHLIVRLGFMIWLGLFVLKHVTSFAPITPGKMLQELLVMGFKCAVANFAISDGINFITNLILNPIMITGTDIGYTLLKGLIEYNTDL